MYISFIYVVFKLSEIEAVIRFDLRLDTIMKTSIIFLILYALLMIKGYRNTIHTSVKDMLSANKQSEYQKLIGLFVVLKAIIALMMLCIGYMLIATICVIVGIYGL